MYRLEELISVLGPEEKQKITRIPLKGKEKKLIQLLLSLPPGEETDAESICQKLELSATHYYKMCSVLLKRCYDALAEEPMYLLRFLRDKALYSHIRGAVRQQEKQALRFSDEDKATFYLKRFHFLIDLPFRYSDKSMIEKAGQDYIRHTSNKDAAKEYVHYHQLLHNLKSNASLFRSEPVKHAMLQELEEARVRLKKPAYSLALYYVHRCTAAYYTWYENHPELALQALNDASDIAPEVAEYFEFDVARLLELMKADTMLSGGKLSAALEAYGKSMPDPSDNSFPGFYFHYEQYIILLLLFNKTTQAYANIKAVFDLPIRTGNDIFATRGHITWAKYYLHTEEFPQAIEALRKASHLNEKSFYLPFDLQIRTLEIIYFILKGNQTFARQLATKNQKLLKSKKEGERFSMYASAWKLLFHLASAEDDNSMRQDSEIPTWFRQVYGGLIDKIYDRKSSEAGNN